MTTSLAARFIPLVPAVALVAAWWFSLVILVETTVLDLTPPKVVVVASLPIVVVAVRSATLTRAELAVGGLVVAYLSWLVVAALARGSMPDVKLTGGYAVFFGAAFLIAWAASRTWPERTAAGVVAVIGAVLAVSFVAVVLERATYAGPGGGDALAPLWSLFRPQVPLADPLLGPVAPAPIHFPSGDASVPRAAGFFAHVNYLAFFAVLASVAAGVALVRFLHAARIRPALIAAVGVTASAMIVAWTYARVGTVAVVLGALAIAATELIRRRGPAGRRWLAMCLAPLLVVTVALVATTALDAVGLRRFAPPPPLSGTPTPAEHAAAVEANASRSTAIRLGMQRLAVELVASSPSALAIGPGQARFERAVHDRSEPTYMADAVGIRDPNSLLLSVAISGGLPGVLLLVGVMAAAYSAVLRASRTTTRGWRAVLFATLLAWLPVWFVAQFFGTYPFNTGEAVILATLLGTGVGAAGRAADVQASS